MEANHLPQIMSDRGITNRELAIVTGTNESQVSRWRSGVTPNPAYRRKIIRKLKLTDEEISALGWPEGEKAGV